MENLEIYFKRTIFAVSSGAILLWLSLFLSYKNLPYSEDIYLPVATGGFPVTAFYYPSGAMGGGVLREDLSIFFVNYIILCGLCFIAAIFLGKRMTPRMTASTLFPAIFLTLVGVFYLMIKFD